MTTLTDTGLVLISTVNTFSPTTASACNPPPTDLCAAAAGASDELGNLFAAYRWKASSGGNSYRILTSTDGGVTWSTSAGPVNLSTKFTITLTSLDGTKMLFAYARYTSSDLTYRVFDGSTWSSATSLAAGMPTNTIKQLSSATVNGTKQAYVAFLSGGYQGALKVAKFSGTGVFEAIETADSTLTHQLPAISVTYDDTIRIYTVSNNIVYETKKNSTGWQVPTTPFGTTFDMVDQLTAPATGFANVIENGVLRTEGPGSFFYFWGWGAPIGSFFTGVCGGSFFFPHDNPDREDSGFDGNNKDEVVANLTSSGFHLTAGYASGNNEDDYTKGIADYFCPSPVFRVHAIITQSGLTYTIQGPPKTAHGEPNPEIREPRGSPYFFFWPSWWWGPYVKWWHTGRVIEQ